MMTETWTKYVLINAEGSIALELFPLVANPNSPVQMLSHTQCQIKIPHIVIPKTSCSMLEPYPGTIHVCFMRFAKGFFRHCLIFKKTVG